MTDYVRARTNMVENQLRPNRVTDERLLAAMAEVPREAFVPEVLRGTACVDEDLPLGGGRYLMEPVVFARLVQAARITAADVVLDVGCATGYSAAVLARLAATVVALEEDAGLQARAEANLAELEVTDATVVAGPLRDGFADQAPYDVIVIEGAVEAVPEALSDQLGEGGRLVAVVGEGAVGRAALFLRVDGVLSRRDLFDAAVPRLPGFEVAPGFVF